MKDADKLREAIEELTLHLRVFALLSDKLTPDTMAKCLAAGFQSVEEETSSRGYNLAQAWDEGVSGIPGVLEAGYPF